MFGEELEGNISSPATKHLFMTHDNKVDNWKKQGATFFILLWLGFCLLQKEQDQT